MVFNAQKATVTLTLPAGGGGTGGGAIAVTTKPSGARIYLDGVDTGSTTPATLTGVSVGSHTVTCKLAGYQDNSATVSVTSAKTTSVPTLTLIKKDPIIGTWRFIFYDTTNTRPDLNGYYSIYQFNSDGTYIQNVYSPPPDFYYYTFTGTWKNQGGNSYTCFVDIVGVTEKWTYDPTRNVIYQNQYPSLLYYPYTSQGNLKTNNQETQAYLVSEKAGNSISQMYGKIEAVNIAAKG
jgi:hypothetical protein